MHILSPLFWSSTSTSELKEQPATIKRVLNIKVPSIDQKQLDKERPQQAPLSGNRMNRNLRAAAKPSGLSLPAGSPEFVSPISVKSRATGMSDIYRQQQYFARAVALDQMDLQAALDQMRTILSTSPQRVYKTSYYRKQTKNHWARDDPAFAVLEIAFLAVASVAYCVAFKRPSLILAVLKFAVQHILGVWFGFGIVVSTSCQFVANNYLSHGSNNNGNAGEVEGRVGGGLSSHHVKQVVEWLYAFDIHCNAFLPLFVVVYATQFFLLPVVLGKSMFSLIVSNTLYAMGISWYIYITHLGYRALPFLGMTEVFLFPIAAVLIVYIVNLVGYPFGFGYNASRIMAHLCFD